MTERIAAGMNRYRAWIDKRNLNVYLASQLLSILIYLTMYGIFVGLFYGWPWVTGIAVAAIPVEVFLGVASMTSWGGGRP